MKWRNQGSGYQSYVAGCATNGVARTDKIIVFDGSFGYLNVSRSLADLLINMAPEASREVEEQLLPKWLQQRGIDLENV
jgi:hypothetical protein